MKKLIYCLVCTVILLNTDIFYLEIVKAESVKKIIKNPPVYNSPIKNKGVIQRREFGDAQGANRGIKVRGIKVRGIKVRGASDAPLSMDDLADDLMDEVGLADDEDIVNPDSCPLPKRIAPLATEDIGFSSTDQPVLRWYISDRWNRKLIFRINERGKVKPLLNTKIDAPEAEGIYKLNLSKYNIRLKPNVDYEWLIVIESGSDEHSADIYTAALIRYVEPSQQLSKQLAQSKKSEHFRIYAQNGYWYDSISHISSLIDSLPAKKDNKMYRAELLKQVNLPNASAYDLK